MARCVSLRWLSLLGVETSWERNREQTHLNYNQQEPLTMADIDIYGDESDVRA